jgi:signal transduction histidine kinase
MVTVEALQEELGRLKKINTALMRRVERNMDIQGDAFSLFQTATLLEQKVYERTAALESVLDELKRSNRELRSAKEAAELAARSKDQFLAGMSHELRTPLNAVLGLAEILQEEIYGPLNPKQLASLRTIEGSGRHLLSLINDILELARLGTVGFKQDVADVDLPEFGHSPSDEEGDLVELRGVSRNHKNSHRRAAPEAGAGQSSRQRGEVHEPWRSHWAGGGFG